jgi:tRNA pseudouridine38-40 synthase
VEYEGTGFHGWQIQPELRTVQGELEEAAARMTGSRPVVRGASRTDAGVHALGQVAGFLTESEIAAAQFAPGLTALSGPDLAVLDAVEAPPDWSARHAARGKTYRYRVWNRHAPSPLMRRTTWHVRAPLDLAAMRTAAADLIGRHDFAAFRAASCDAPTTMRDVTDVEVVPISEGLIEIRFRATAFLQHMVRIMTGTLVEVGKGRTDPREVALIRESKDRRLAGPTAPARGLCLVAVHY